MQIIASMGDNGRDKILEAILVLMDEQLKTLQTELTPDDVLKYGQRRREVVALIRRLSGDVLSPGD